uniref:Fatty-acid and retinol-binding protein 8 n=1 Tax=Aphelenchoides besseyi TaxID=269767 RepID=A0A1S5RMF4_9BILA|nr:fatty-acid and retinol-binding protein 8 [Aphelenchoides besseyi]
MSAQVFTVLALFLTVNSSLALLGEQSAPQENPTNTFGNQNRGRSLLAILPPHVQALLPPSVRQDLSQLSVKDALVARTFIQHIPKFTSVEEARQTLRRYSPRLDQLAEQKAEKVRAFVEARRNALQPDTRTFFDKATVLAQKHGHEYVQLVDSQSDSTKHDLDINFPIVSHLLNSPAGLALSNYLRRD